MTINVLKYFRLLWRHFVLLLWTLLRWLTLCFIINDCFSSFCISFDCEKFLFYDFCGIFFNIRCCMDFFWTMNVAVCSSEQAPFTSLGGAIASDSRTKETPDALWHRIWTDEFVGSRLESPQLLAICGDLAEVLRRVTYSQTWLRHWFVAAEWLRIWYTVRIWTRFSRANPRNTCTDVMKQNQLTNYGSILRAWDICDFPYDVILPFGYVELFVTVLW